MTESPIVPFNQVATENLSARHAWHACRRLPTSDLDASEWIAKALVFVALQNDPLKIVNIKKYFFSVPLQA